MIIKKITIGYVEQIYDTEKGSYISQSFITGDTVLYETENGKQITGENIPYLSFDMVQPEVKDGR